MCKQNCVDEKYSITGFDKFDQSSKQIKSAEVRKILQSQKQVMSYKPHPTLNSRIKSPLSKSTTEFFQSQSTINQLISQFFLPKKHDYSQNVLQFYSNTHNFTQKQYKILNKENQALHATLFYKSKLQKPPQNCILYCHGFGSTRLQAVHLLKVLTEDIALCCFDFSGSGKSQGSIITYGSKEKEDIYCVLTYLKSLNFSHFILWGRSMGATACLLYSIKYEQKEQLQDQSVIFQVVDSPFYSFEKISLELAKKFVSMPYFGTNIVLDMMKKRCKTLGQYDPFSVSLQNINLCKVPTLFIYSENDEIVPCNNSEELCSKFTAFYEKMIIPQNHNAPRSPETLSEIIKKIQIQLKKYQIGKKNGIVFRSFISCKSNHSKSHKKGIERSLRKQNLVSSICEFSKPSSIHQIPEVDQLKLESKCQTPNTHSTDNFFTRPNQSTDYFSNKPISFSTSPHQFNQKYYQSSFIQTPKTDRYGKYPYEKISYVHNANQTIKNNANQPQVSENVYQMRKPLNVNNKFDKQLKRYSSPIQTEILDNPLTNFSRQEILDENSKEKTGYRDGKRRPYSTSKKLNISLSKLKDFKQRNFIQQTPKEPYNQNTSYKTGISRQKNAQSSQYISTSLKSMIRPISQCKNEPIKAMLKTNTPTTKAPSVSSSMDNLHLLGAIKSVKKVRDSEVKQRRMVGKQKSKAKEIQFRKEREIKKVRSSENIYFDRNVYKYGF